MNNKIQAVTSAAATNNPFFWRNVTEEDVWNAISGSFLGTICKALAKNYTPKAPLPIILMQAITLMACALTHKKEKIIEDWSQPDLIDCDPGQSPATQSRLYINTGEGNVPNAYVLIVAPSGAGKGLTWFRLVNSLGYQMISSGSLEGIKDAAMANPHLLIENQEFGSVLEGKGYKEDYKKGLTDMFNAGRFEDVLSVRKSKEPRVCEWFYPVVYGAIQPEVLRTLGRSLDITQGLFARFLIGYLPEKESVYDINPCNLDLKSDRFHIGLGLHTIASMSGIVDVPTPHYNTDFSRPIREVIDKKMVPLVLRYANEYLPRIALMLAIPADIGGELELPKLTEEHFRRATIVLHRILTMAERALGTLSDLEGRNRQQEENLTRMAGLLNRLSDRGEPITLAAISKNSSGTGWDAKTREGLLNEMAERSWITIHSPSGVCDKVKKGCTIILNKEKLPMGVL